SWFAKMFPEQAALYGVPFLETRWTDQDGLNHFVPAYLNDDFFCSVIGGNRDLGHQVVYFEREQQWWFYDPVPGAFCPTSSAKLQLLLSNYLIRCAEDCGPLVDVTDLIVAFRKDEILERVVRKAKSMLQCD